MADTKISALAPAAALGGGEALPAVQAGATVRLTPAQLASFVLASPALTGTPTAPTAAAGDSSARVATTGFVAAALPSVTKGNVAAADPGPTADTAAGYAVGSGWLNSQTGLRWLCLDATAGAAAWAPMGYTDHPGYVSGRTYPAPSSTRASVAVAVDTLYACRIDIKQRVAIGALACNIGTVSTGNMRLALYANAGGIPGAKLVEAASQPSTGTTGAVSAALAATTVVNPGVYWLACIFSATPSLYSIAAADVTQAEFIGAATVAQAIGATSNGVTGLTGSGATYAGGLPATFGTATPRYGVATPLLGIVAA